MLISGMVGVSPGTTTLRLGEGGRGRQDPGVTVRNNDGYLMGGGLGIVPNDFELAKIYGYLPVHEGWITQYPNRDTVFSGLGCGGGCSRMGAAAEPPLPTDAIALEQLQVTKLIEELKTTRHIRFWTAITALSTVTGVLITLAARKGRK